MKVFCAVTFYKISVKLIFVDSNIENIMFFSIIFFERNVYLFVICKINFLLSLHLPLNREEPRNWPTHEMHISRWDF